MRPLRWKILLKGKDVVLMIIVGLLILCAIFPKYDLTYTHGLDGSLSWIFNHIYNSGFHIGKNIIFPHGPLAFFMYPLQENLPFAIFITTIIQLTLVINIFYILKDTNSNDQWLVAPIVSFLLLNLLSFNLLLLANIILLFLLYNDHKKVFLKYIAFFLIAFSFYVKAYVAILSGTILLSFLVIELITYKKVYRAMLDFAIWLTLILIFWVTIYGSLSGIFQYAIGILNMAMDNSAAISFYPDNNWICLSIFLIITFSIAFLQKSFKGYYFGFLVTLSIFAGWKHGISREDIHHSMEFLIYIILIFFLLLIYVKRNVKYNLIIISVAILLFGINLKNSVRYQTYKIDIISVNNLVDIITDYSGLKDEANKIIAENISFNKLPEDVVSKIGNAKVDVYPWDYSVIPANNLTWQPRPQIQSHTSFTPWVDKKNADHFGSSAAPEFIIWHLFTSSQYSIKKTFESIDGRYLLDDEPQTMIQILSHYNLYYKDTDFIVYQKRKEPLTIETKLSAPEQTTWDKWISVPDTFKDLCRVKVNIKSNFLGALKNFFYKGNHYDIYYKFSNGVIRKNKIIPKIATQGIWLNPYINSPKNNFSEPQVKEILFKCSNTSLSKRDIEITWENISFGSAQKTGHQNYVNAFFGKNQLPANNELIQVVNDFERPYKEWENVYVEDLTNDGYSGVYGCKLPAGQISATYTFNLDTFPNKQLLFSANCWIKPNVEMNAMVVISVENSRMKQPVMAASNIKGQIIDNKGWNNISWFHEFKNEAEGNILKVYIVNLGQEPLLYDDLKVRIEQRFPECSGTFYEPADSLIQR